VNNGQTVLLDTNLPLPSFRRGKVRDIYGLGDRLLIISTDRISAFDIVLPCGIPGKGTVLNLLSAFWFMETANIISNHLVKAIDSSVTLGEVKNLSNQPEAIPDSLIGRSMLVAMIWNRLRARLSVTPMEILFLQAKLSIHLKRGR